MVVRPHPRSPTLGLLAVDGRVMTCALGKGGLSARKREGDGATPIGRFHTLALIYRRERTDGAGGTLPRRPVRADDGWADDPASGLYNRHVWLPCPVPHERLMRDDGLYDVVVMIDHNTRPRVRGLGSAVFLHCAREGMTPTAGCVALPPDVWRRLGGTLLSARPIVIAASPRPVRKRRTFRHKRRSAI
ncbi:L,D-transpeptidase family protein [Amorphus sp. 3PC139-8]